VLNFAEDFRGYPFPEITRCNFFFVVKDPAADATDASQP
jgi:hypothetical protein